MPRKVLPALKDFLWFKRELTTRGFRPMYEVEFRRQFQRLGLKAPRPRQGREEGFTFFANNLSVVVWTTWLARQNKARESDAGWVLIAEGDRVLYFSHPIHRTRNFFLNLFRQAWLAQWRALHRPLCPECKKWMSIARGKGLKARYWVCGAWSQHDVKGTVRLDWDYGLPPRAKRMVALLRRARARYRKQMLCEGREVVPAVLRRKPWRVERPYNVIRAGK